MTSYLGGADDPDAVMYSDSEIAAARSNWRAFLAKQAPEVQRFFTRLDRPVTPADTAPDAAVQMGD